MDSSQPQLNTEHFLKPNIGGGARKGRSRRRVERGEKNMGGGGEGTEREKNEISSGGRRIHRSGKGGYGR